MSSSGLSLKTIVNQRMYETSKALEMFEYVFLAVLAIAIPLLLQHPQLLVGSVVNFVLILSAIQVKGWGKLISLVVIPSVSALLGTYLFGPFQFFLLYMIPFIWIGNALLVLVIKYLVVVKKIHLLVSLPMAAVVKAGFLFAMAFMLIQSSVIPAAAAPVFATGMGIVQFETALLGGCAAWVVNLLLKSSLFKKRTI